MNILSMYLQLAETINKRFMKILSNTNIVDKKQI